MKENSDMMQREEQRKARMAKRNNNFINPSSKFYEIIVAYVGMAKVRTKVVNLVQL